MGGGKTINATLTVNGFLESMARCEVRNLVRSTPTPR
jgi:hypothetical protein